MHLTSHRSIIALAVIGLTSSALSQTEVDRALADALEEDVSNRQSLLGTGAGTVNVFGYTQFRYLWNNRDDGPGDNDGTNGFQIARARIGVNGEVSDDFGYYVLGDFGSTGTFMLHDAYGSYRASDNLAILFGQMKAPFTREFMTSDTMLLAVERSIVDRVFNAGRTQGVALASTGDEFRWWVAASDGVVALNSDIESGAEADFAFTARGEWKIEGLWEQFGDLTSFPGGTRGILLGAAGHYQSGGETVGTADMDVLAFTADAAIEGDGWNVYGSAHWMNIDAAGGSDTDDFGFLLQGGYFLNESWEAFARYDVVLPDDDRAGSPDEFSTITVGANHYFIPESHAVKFTADVQVFLDEQASSIVMPSTLYGVLESGDSGQFTLRIQMQLMF